MNFTDAELIEINNELSKMNAFQRLKWARDIFKEKFCITSSFGLQSAVMVHLVYKIDNMIPIIFIDTGYHFSETIAYMEYFQKIFKLNIIIIKPELTRMEYEEKSNYANENDQDSCCRFNKVIPLQNALKKYDCWGTGIRKDQTEARKKADFFMLEDREKNRYKLSPLLDYSGSDIRLHYSIYNLAAHPLARKGYKSVGCDCCTTPNNENESERAGRWNGIKTECGIHLINGSGDGI